MRLSYSALDTFKQCPLKYKFQYIDKIKAPKSPQAIFGTLIHSALKSYHDPRRAVSPTEEDLLQFWSMNWKPDAFSDPQQEAMAFAQGVQVLKNYYAKNSAINFDILDLEIPFEAPVVLGQDTHFVTGKIDRIDKIENDAFEIIDYKTAKKMPAQKSVDTDLQLAVYHLGVANRWPSIIEENRPVKTSLYFLKHGEKLSSNRTVQDLQLAKENIIQLLEKVDSAQKQEKFPPLPGPLCDWCAYQKICPVWKHKFKEEKIFFNDQDVQTLINEYMSLKDDIDQRDNRMAEIKDTFAKFMDQEDMERLFSDDGYISRNLIQRFKYDPLLIKDILDPLGKWSDVLKLDEAKLKKAAKELPSDIRQKIENAKKLDKEYKIFSILKTGKKKAKK